MPFIIVRPALIWSQRFFFALPFHLQPKSFTVNDYSTTGGWLGLVAEFRPHVLGNGGFEVHQVLEAFFFVSLDV